MRVPYIKLNICASCVFFELVFRCNGYLWDTIVYYDSFMTKKIKTLDTSFFKIMEV